LFAWGDFPFSEIYLKMKKARNSRVRITGWGTGYSVWFSGGHAAFFGRLGSSESETAKTGRFAAFFRTMPQWAFSSAETLDTQGFQDPTSFLLPSLV